MSNSIKFTDDIYLDSSGVAHNRKTVQEELNSLQEHVLLEEGIYNDDITLNDSLANYRRITIFYLQNAYFGTTYGSISVENPNGKNVNISEIFYITTFSGSSYYGAYLLSRVYSMNGNKLTKINAGNYKILGTNGTGTWTVSDGIRITKVVGYK